MSSIRNKLPQQRQKTRTKDEERQVRKTILDSYRAFEKLDSGLLDENFSHTPDLMAFGTDWDEKFDGWNQYRNVHKVQFKAVKKFKFTSKELTVHVDGKIAWVSDRPHWNIETKAGEKVDSDMRITAVLRKESSDKWRIVQWHVSTGVRERLHEY